MATLGAATVTRARAQLPRWGVWTAEVRTDRDAGLIEGGPATLTIADLVLVGHVVHGGVHVGTGYYLLAGGAKGWRTVVKERAYRNDAGVKLSLVVADLARDAGEKVAPGFEDRRLGPAWTRPSRAADGRPLPASSSLQAASPGAWYVGEDGVTRIGRRSASTLKVPAELVLEPMPARASAVVALEEIAALLPETTIPDIGTVAAVVHTLAPGKLRSRLYLDGAA